MTLHVYVYENDVTDWFVAESAQEARDMAAELFKSDEYDDMKAEDYVQAPDESMLTINSDDDRHGDEPEKHTCAEWCAINGKGLLCSTEY